MVAHDKGARLVRNHLFTGLDAAALVGGFIYFIQIFFSILVKCYNRKLYIKEVLTDSYLLCKNEGYLCVPPGYLSKHDRKTPKGGSSTTGSTPRDEGHLKKMKSEYNEGGGRRAGNGYGQASSRTANLERISEVDGEDKSNYEGYNEGGRVAATSNNSGIEVPPKSSLQNNSAQSIDKSEIEL